MRPGNLRRQSVILIALVVAALLVAGLGGLLDGLELSAVNLAFQVRGLQPARSPVVIVAIDDASCATTGLQWPWPRTYLAQLVDRLKAAGAEVAVTSAVGAQARSSYTQLLVATCPSAERTVTLPLDLRQRGKSS